jgi:quinol monooxygenase YgiN
VAAAETPEQSGSGRPRYQIIVAGTIDVAPDRREACLEASRALQQATRRDEPGCLAYVFAADPVVPGRISVFERWTEAGTLLAHFAHPNYVAMRTVLYEHGIIGADVRRYRIDAEAPVYDEDRVARPHRWPE